MRFIPWSCLHEGMEVAKSLYDKNGQLLINNGAELKESYINRIKELGYQGIYINDELSRDLHIENTISDQLRIKAIQTIKESFIQKSIYNQQIDFYNHIDDTVNVVEEIIDQIMTKDISMINLIDLKCFDEYTYYHSVNVCILAIMVGLGLGYNKERIIKLGLGAILHDIGKVFIDRSVINKTDVLTSGEYEDMKNHTILGYRHLRKTYNVLPTVYRCVLDHHERYDGTGYPYQLIGEGISEFGRIVCVCDVYDALVSNRPYRKALLPSEAMEYIMGNSGQMFDPKLVELFIKKVAPYPVGTLIDLSNGYKAIVIENYQEHCMRPKIRVINDKKGSDMCEEWDLSKDYQYTNVTITGVLRQ